MADFPNKPVHIVTSNLGGDVSVLANLMAHGMSGNLGQPVTVENQNGTKAMDVVHASAADGYTLLVFAQTFWTTPLMERTSWDPVADFTPIALAATSPLMMVVHPAVPANSASEFIALAKSQPGKLRYGSGINGASSQFAAVLFTHMAGITVERVSYKQGGLTAVKDLIAGKVQMMIPSWGSAVPAVKAGQLRALAVTSAQPSPVAPGLPTVAAAGIPGYEIIQYIAMFAPAGTPDAAVQRLNQAAVAYLQTEQAREELLHHGLEAAGSTPEILAATIRSEMSRWAKVIKDVGIAAN